MLFGIAVQLLVTFVRSEDVYFGRVHLCTKFNGTTTYNDGIIIETTVWKRVPHTFIARVHDLYLGDFY